MKNTRIKIAGSSFAFILLLVLLYGCLKEEFDSSKFDASFDLQSGLAIPIGFSHMGFEKYLSKVPLNDELRISKDGFLSLYYSAEIDSGVMGDMLSVDDASVNKSILNQTGTVIFLGIPGTSFDLADSIIIPITSPQVNARIDSIKLLSGTLQMNITSSNLTGTITIQINSLKQNGNSFNTTKNLANPDISISLANYTIIPEHDISGNNLVKCSMSIHLQSPSGPINPGAPIINILTRINSLRYETIYGDFGGYTIDFPSQTIETPFFQQLTGGQIVFADPKLKLFFSNSAGVPFGISFSRIDAIDRNNAYFPLTGTGIPIATNPKIIRYPALSQTGQTIIDSMIIDKNNSNLPDFIAANPDSIGIKASAAIVPLTPPAVTFVNHDSKYKVSAAIELPLWGMADFLILLDTMEFDYLNSTLPPPDEIEKLIIRTSITNSFPTTAYPQIYLLDENYVLLDSLFTGKEKIEGAGDTNNDGIADPHKQPPIDIDLSRSKIDNLLNTRHLVVKGRILTTDFPMQNVKLYSSYFLDYNAGLIARLKIKTGK
jgi:hypothetical protein